jgi:flagellar biosynthesis protein FlhG
LTGEDSSEGKPARKLGRGLSDVSHLFLSSAEARMRQERGPEPAGRTEARRRDDKVGADEAGGADDEGARWLPRATYISVTSGSGVRGKSTLAANLAFGLHLRGRRVAMVDADPERPGLLDLTASVPSDLPSGLLVAGDSYGGIVAADAVARASEPPVPASRMAERPSAPDLIRTIDAAAREAQVVIIDTSSDGEPSRAVWKTSSLCIVVAEPGAEKMRATYVAIKRVHSASPTVRIGLVINLVRSYAQGEECFRKLAEVSRKFLKINLRNYGYILCDPAVSEASERAVPVVKAFPDAGASKSITWILGLIVMDESAIARRRREVTYDGCALKKGRLAALKS